MIYAWENGECWDESNISRISRQYITTCIVLVIIIKHCFNLTNSTHSTHSLFSRVDSFF